MRLKFSKKEKELNCSYQKSNLVFEVSKQFKTLVKKNLKIPVTLYQL